MNTVPALQDFALLRGQCEKTNRITERISDDFLIAFAARHHDLEKKMRRLKISV